MENRKIDPVYALTADAKSDCGGVPVGDTIFLKISITIDFCTSNASARAFRSRSPVSGVLRQLILTKSMASTNTSVLEYILQRLFIPPKLCHFSESEEPASTHFLAKADSSDNRRCPERKSLRIMRQSLLRVRRIDS
jgi:hypothetical protein